MVPIPMPGRAGGRTPATTDLPRVWGCGGRIPVGDEDVNGGVESFGPHPRLAAGMPNPPGDG